MTKRTDYGHVTYMRRKFTLTNNAEITSRMFPFGYHEVEEGESFYFEMSAPALDPDGNKCTVYWIFEEAKGEEKELDSYDYDLVDRVELD